MRVLTRWNRLPREAVDSIARDIQNPTGNSPQPLALMDLELICAMRLHNLQRLLQASTILWSSLIGFYSIKYTIKKETEVIKPPLSNRGSSIRWNKDDFDNSWDYFQERKKKSKKEGRWSWSSRRNLTRVWTDCLERQERPADSPDRLVTVALAWSYHSKFSLKYFSIGPVQTSCQTKVRKGWCALKKWRETLPCCIWLSV